jgi:hypothetical protein
LMPHVNEVNAIAKELNKQCSFEIALVRELSLRRERLLLEIYSGYVYRSHQLPKEISAVAPKSKSKLSKLTLETFTCGPAIDF